MHRLRQAAAGLLLLIACWLGMQAMHEVGHVLGAWISGGRVQGVVLHPLKISRTDVSPNPHPLLVAWMGPIVGVLAPLALWGLAAGVRAAIGRGAVREKLAAPSATVFRMATASLRFFAGFCLIANGCYIAFGSLGAVGDAGDLLRHGSPAPLLWLFGALCIPAGLWLWRGQGRQWIV